MVAEQGLQHNFYVIGKNNNAREVLLSAADMTTYDDHDEEYDANYDVVYMNRQDHGGVLAADGITTKVPPSFNGRTSWFRYEQQVDDWCDLTTLDKEKQGPALKNRLVDTAETYKEIFDRDSLKDPNNGVKYFKDTLRPHFVKGVQSVFLWRFFTLMKFHRGSMEMIHCIGIIAVLRKRLNESWMDLLKLPDINDPYYRQAIQNANRGQPAAQQRDPDDVQVHAAHCAQLRAQHAGAFPLNENLFHIDLRGPLRSNRTTTRTITIDNVAQGPRGAALHL